MNPDRNGIARLISLLGGSVEAAVDFVYSLAYAINKRISKYSSDIPAKSASFAISVKDLINDVTIHTCLAEKGCRSYDQVVLEGLMCLVASAGVPFRVQGGEKGRLRNPASDSIVVLEPLVPLRICTQLFRAYRRIPDIEYRAMRQLCHINGARYTDNTVESFRVCSVAANTVYESLLAAQIKEHSKLRPASPPRPAVNRPKIARELVASLESFHGRDRKKMVSFFLDAAHAVGCLGTDWQDFSKIFIRGICDADYMLSRIFGLRTSMPGFDSLFGGGLLLPWASEEEQWLGKTIIVEGTCGSGKTLLASHLAFEAARKGGIAFIFALEQEHVDLRRQFHSFGLISRRDNLVMAESAGDFLQKARRGFSGAGLIGIGKVSKVSIQSHFDALKELLELARFATYPLRMIVVDPINSVLLDANTDPYTLRDETNVFFQYLKEQSVCGVFTVETEADPVQQFYHEKNVADIVIRLTTDRSERHKYTQRFLEILKSRGQATHIGVHSLVIQKRHGLILYPSLPALITERRGRQVYATGSERTPSGSHDLDIMLCAKSQEHKRMQDEHGAHKEGGFQENSVSLLRGPKGCGRTELALLFLLCPKQITSARHGIQTRSLYVTFKHSTSSVFHLVKNGPVLPSLRKYYGKDWNRIGTVVLDRLQILSLQGGYLRAGDFFHRLTLEFKRARDLGTRIEKVVIDDVQNIEHNCPLISSEPAFVPALMNILRTENCTSLIICGGAEEDTSDIHRELIDTCDCIVDLRRVFFRGRSCTAIHVSKSQAMEHDPAVYGITFDRRSGIEITRQFSLVTNVMSGQPREVPVRLFLHCETEQEAEYNRQIQSALGNTLASTVDLRLDHDIVTSLRMSDIGLSAAMQELQIVQLDEHQLSYAKDHWLEPYPLITKPSLRETFACLVETFSDEQEFWAFPYYGNLSFIAYDEDKVGSLRRISWQEIEEMCASSKSIVFDFPKVSPENYNCLFFEILLDELRRTQHRRSLEKALCDKSNCLRTVFSDRKLVRRAIRTFWRVGHKAEMLNPASFKYLEHDLRGHIQGQPKVYTVSKEAFIWRHWYGTFNQMLTDMQRSEQDTSSSIRVKCLPGNMATSGDWYLGVTKTSYGKDTGADIIRMLSSYDSALERLERGIGFPMHADFIRGNTYEFPSAFWELAGPTFGELYENAFRRSSFGCYFSAAKFIAYHLKSILRIPDEKTLERQLHDMTKLLGDIVCDACSRGKGQCCLIQDKRRCIWK